MKRVITILVAILASGVAAHAATFNLQMVMDSNNGVYQPGAWTVYGWVTNGSQGLASYQLNITGVSTITTAANQGPRAVFEDSTAVHDPVSAGFSLLRAVLNKGPSPQGGTSYEIDASQDTLAFNADPASTVLIPNMGISAGSFSTYRPAAYDVTSSVVQDNWSGRLMLAKGTYSGAWPDFSYTLPTAGNVFADISTGRTQAATVYIYRLPEPAAVGMTTACAVASFARRRRRIQ